MGGPLHSLIICGDLHDLEFEILKEYLVEGSKFELEQKWENPWSQDESEAYDQHKFG